MAAATVHKTDNRTVPLRTQPSLPGPSKHHATCAWCRRDCRSIVELIDHVEAAHLDHSDTPSEACASGLTKGI